MICAMLSTARTFVSRFRVLGRDHRLELGSGELFLHPPPECCRSRYAAKIL